MPIKQQINILSRAFGRGVFPHQMSWILDLPGRGLIMSAATVAGRLPLKPDAQVLEVGPGSGYYSLAVAQCIPQGRLTLFDIQQDFLDQTARKLSAAGLSNFATQRAEGASWPFADQSFDAIFMVTVFGEIEGRDAFLKEAARVLKDGGALSITEHHPDPDFESAEQVSDALRAHGFVPVQKLGWRWAYTLNAVTPAAAKG